MRNTKPTLGDNNFRLSDGYRFPYNNVEYKKIFFSGRKFISFSPLDIAWPETGCNEAEKRPCANKRALNACD